jgi:hypothetical protein
MSNNISTNFSGFDNLNSSTALHHVTVPILFSANVVIGRAVGPTDLIISGVYEAGAIITNIQILGTLPGINPHNWAVEAVSEAGGTPLLIATFADNAANPAVTPVNYFTKIVAVPSGNFRLRFNFENPATYNVAPPATAPTMYVTYMNAH